MTRINTILAYHSGDIETAKALLQWIALQNGGLPLAGTLILLGDGSLTREQRMEVKTIAKSAFSMVFAYPVHVEPTMQRWPTGPNLMFQQGMRIVSESFRHPFFWMEPDCVTLKAGWLEALEAEYYNQPMRYMGVFSLRGEGDTSLPDRWMSGVGVYPQDAYSEMAVFCGSEKPFDVVSSALISPKMNECRSIQHFWGTKDIPPTFSTKKSKSPNGMTLLDLNPDAVVFHRCKDGSLLRLLSGPEPEPIAQEEEEEPQAVQPPASRPTAIPPPPRLGSMPSVSSDAAFGGGNTKVMRSTTDASRPLVAG